MLQFFMIISNKLRRRMISANNDLITQSNGLSNIVNFEEETELEHLELDAMEDMIEDDKVGKELEDKYSTTKIDVKKELEEMIAANKKK